MKHFLLLAGLSFALCQTSIAQILCVECYNQNDSISTGVTNLIVNGGFENTTCLPSTGVIGEHSSWCPNSLGYACDFSNWTGSGGAGSTYSCLYNTSVGKSIIIEGNNAVYFGNFYCDACSNNTEDTSCLIDLGCSDTGPTDSYPYNPDPSFGGATGVSLSQTVNNLVPGNAYVLEFWAGGEEYYGGEGLFALDIGFGDTMLRCKSTGPGEIGKTYIIQFKATSSSQTIKFTNWGHICSNCTELVLDNVRLYPISQLSSTITPCIDPIAFAASNTSLCQKFCIDFADSSTNNPTAWQWIFQGGSPATSTEQNPNSICYDDPGVYDVTLITTTANGTDTLTLNDYITVHPTPANPTISQNGYTLTSSAADFYQWQLDAVDIPGATDQSYDVLQTGFYTVIVSDSIGCKSSISLYVLISGIDEMKNAGISVYPNPSSGNFIVNFDHSMAEEVSIEVVNAIGQSVYSSQQTISSGLKKEIDLDALATGVYFLEIKSNDFFARKKIIVSR